MTIYFANENGDWWGTNGTETTIYVFDTDKLTQEQKIAIAGEWDSFDPEEDDLDTLDEIIAGVLCQDKFERIIWEYGRHQLIRI